MIVADPERVVTFGTKHAPKEYTYIAYHKPAGELTHSGEGEDRDLIQRLEADYKVTGLSPVGRLEKAFAGLIILTNDGRVTRKLFADDALHEREYLVEVDKRIFGAVFNNLEKGVKIERTKTKPATAHRINATTFTLTLTEGKKHQVKRMLAALGYQIKKLVRLRVASVSLGKIKPGQYRVLKGAELTAFLNELGISN